MCRALYLITKEIPSSGRLHDGRIFCAYKNINTWDQKRELDGKRLFLNWTKSSRPFYADYELSHHDGSSSLHLESIYSNGVREAKDVVHTEIRGVNNLPFFFLHTKINSLGCVCTIGRPVFWYRQSVHRVEGVRLFDMSQSNERDRVAVKEVVVVEQWQWIVL